MMISARFFRNRDGAAAAEMALILPIAILLLFTSFEVGRYMYQRHQVVKGLRDGARYAARQSFSDMSCTAAIPTGVQTSIQNLVSTGALSGGTPRVTGWAPTDVTLQVDCTNIGTTVKETGIYTSSQPARKILVSTSFAYQSLFGGLGIVDNTFRLGGYQQATVMGI